ncbi:MAG TPA: hypothetical protein VIK27_00665 [Candidatus Aquilonibacter sp.]
MTRALLLGLFAVLGLTAQMPAPVPVVPKTPLVIATVVSHNAAVQHYTFDVDARIALLTFPWIRFTLHGHGTYTRGGEYSVHFDNVPWFGKGFETMPMSALDVTNFPSLYTIVGSETQGSVTTLTMHDVKKSPLIDAHAKIDAAEGLLQILWRYDYGGHVKLTIVPRAVSGFYFPGSEEAEIVMPRYRAMAWATYSNYHVDTSASPTSSAASATGDLH